MRGVITARHVIRHSLSIVRLWGVATYFNCLWAAVSRKQCTFLGVLYPSTVGTSALNARRRPSR